MAFLFSIDLINLTLTNVNENTFQNISKNHLLFEFFFWQTEQKIIVFLLLKIRLCMIL